MGEIFKGEELAFGLIKTLDFEDNIEADFFWRGVEAVE